MTVINLNVIVLYEPPATKPRAIKHVSSMRLPPMASEQRTPTQLKVIIGLTLLHSLRQTLTFLQMPTVLGPIKKMDEEPTSIS